MRNTHIGLRGRPAPPPDRARVMLVLVGDAASLSQLCGRPVRPWDQAFARSRAFSLDARLAAGSSPDGTRLIALRARRLVSLTRRQRLASDWDRLVRAARERPSAGRRAPLCRDRIVAAEPDIRQLELSLRSALPVPVRGVAMASHLLVDGTGPVYNRRAAVDLPTAVREAIRQMDPSAELLSGQPG
jgi:hypothetical protein